MIDALAWLVVLPSMLALAILSIELGAAQLRPRTRPWTRSADLTILIPAHDEQAGIARCIEAVRASAPPGSSILVVADNCSDRTARIARAAGAEVIERHDPVQRGKGHALGFARRHLRAAPPAIVAVLDADCAIEGDGLARLAGTAAALNRPVQSAYLFRPIPDRGPLVAVSGFALLLRNLVRQRGLAWIGAPALLTGSGMAFPWRCFDAAPLDTDDIAEDLNMGIALAQLGMAPVFLPQVTTWSDPAARLATFGQRTRWEQGFLRGAVRHAPHLLLSGEGPLLWLGLHLCVPPLALLGLLCAASLLVSGGLITLGASGSAALGLIALLVAAAGLVLLGWWRFGRAQASARQLLLAPAYILWKLPLYLGAIRKPERMWKRTPRD
ncbi:glycosyltransferase family 2 protein [Rhizorhabdus sp. FW153]|uniref:glycosyltransferase family 2 protein n=1 Tax=Rhizorhabdus sp. FW153 TaxID=3400216 RepID=UPI003CF18B61